MNQLIRVIFKDTNKDQFYSILKKLIVIAFASSFLALIDGGGPYFIPLILGSFIVYQFYEEKQRIKFVVYFLPFIFLAIFFTSGGSFLFHNLFNETLIFNERDLSWMFAGVWASYIVIIIVWMFFKVQIKVIHFVLLSLLIPIPYLLNLNAVAERFGIFFFYFLWNAGLSVVLSLMFSQNKSTKINL